MKQRFYLLLPDVNQASAIVDELLLKKVNIEQIHGLSKDPTKLESIPEATEFQKHDIKHSIIIGFGLGVILGIITGIVIHNVLDMEYSGLLIVTAILGAIIGAWSASMVGMMTPNIELKPFQKSIEKGAILLIVDLPSDEARDITEAIEKKTPKT